MSRAKCISPGVANSPTYKYVVDLIHIDIHIDIYIDMVILENIDIDIAIDMDFLENIDIDKGILPNIDIDKISYQMEFGISNRANPHSCLRWKCTSLESPLTQSVEPSVAEEKLEH